MNARINSDRPLRIVLFIVMMMAAPLLSPSPSTQSAAAEGELRFLEERYVYRQVHMGLQVRVVLYAANEEASRRAAGAAFAEIARLDAVFSDYRPDSELMHLMARSGGPPVRVGGELFSVLEQALELSRQTQGAFDVTAGPLTRLWRQARAESRLPAAVDLQQAAALVGFGNVRLDSERGTVELMVPRMRLDLGAIAKGYIIDRALSVLRAHDVESSLVEAGGDIVVGAPPPGKDGWQILIRHPSPCEISLVHAAVSTSGDTAQFVEIGGMRYSHTVDPRTGLGLTSRRVATVVAPNGATADSLATVLTLLGEAAADELLRHYPEARAMVGHIEDGNGDLMELEPSISCRALQVSHAPARR